MKTLFILILTGFLSASLAIDSPIEPKDMQAMLGKGFDVSWVEFTKNIEAYSNLQVIAMADSGFSTARIRTKLPADSTLFTLLDQVIQDCFDNSIIPMIAYNAADYEADPTGSNMSIDSIWWSTVADHYKDYSHKLLFDLNIEWSDLGGKDVDGVNSWYNNVTPAIRATNPTRIILYSPIKLSNPSYLKDMVIPSSAGSYVMAEFHSYAAGPNPDSLSANGHPNSKYWTTGTDYQKGLVVDMISSGKAWQDSTGIYTWFGAWMAGNKNHGDTFGASDQAIFAKYFVHTLDSFSIPWAINTLDMYYDIDNDIWIDSMAPVLQSLSGSSPTSITTKKLLSSSARVKVKNCSNGILISGENSGNIQIVTIMGQVVEEHHDIKAGLIATKLSKGIYFMNWSSRDASSVYKLIIR